MPFMDTILNFLHGLITLDFNVTSEATNPPGACWFKNLFAVKVTCHGHSIVITIQIYRSSTTIPMGVGAGLRLVVN